MASISVVMACYNEEKNISRAIESILNQTFTDFELIIVDDGSTDRTSSIVLKYQFDDIRIQYYKMDKNSGLASSLNYGIYKASTDIIARMDADDCSLPSRFEIQFDFLKKNPNVDVVGTGAKLYLKSTNEYLREHFLPEFHNEIIKLKYKNTFVYHPTVMFRKSIFIREGGYCPAAFRSEDVDLWIRIMDKVEFYNIKIPLIEYYISPSFKQKDFFAVLRTYVINMIRRKELIVNMFLIFRYLSIGIVMKLGYKSKNYRK